MPNHVTLYVNQLHVTPLYGNAGIVEKVEAMANDYASVADCKIIE